jgi:hypothetical protein
MKPFNYIFFKFKSKNNGYNYLKSTFVAGIILVKIKTEAIPTKGNIQIINTLKILDSTL